MLRASFHAKSSTDASNPKNHYKFSDYNPKKHYDFLDYIEKIVQLKEIRRLKTFHFVQFRGVKTFHFVQFEGEKLSILCSLP